MNTADLKSFHYLENGDITFSVLDTVKTEKKLDPGSYILSYIGYPKFEVTLKQDQDIETSKIHSFPDKDRIDNIMKSFVTPKVIDKVSKLGFNHKLGILLYGKEGTGKSTIMKHYYSKLIKENKAIVFHIDTIEFTGEVWNFIIQVRRIQDNPIVVVFDEFDSWFGGGGFSNKEAMIKKILDGGLSINNCIIMASTNYIDAIPKAVKDRPSRFKYKLDIEGIQNVEEVNSIVTTMLSDMFTPDDIASFSEDLKGNTLDYIKQFCLDKVMDIESYSPKKKTVGFNMNS